MPSSAGARDDVAFDMHAHGLCVADAASGETPTEPDATLACVRSLLAIGAVVFAVACVAFAIVRSHSELHPPYPKGQAVAAARRDAETRSALAGTGWDGARVIPLDRTHWRVTFFAGPREVLDVAVDPRGHVDASEP